MNTVLKTITALTACLCLVSCWAPEKFTASLNVDKSKNFKFIYNGTIAFGPALGEIKQRGQLSAQGEAEMKKGEAALRKEPGFKSVEYAGDGRFKVQFEQTGPVENGKKVFIDIVEFRIGPDGRIWILGAELKPEGRQQLAAINLKLDGTIKVTSDLAVVQHNATSTPSLGGLIGAYEWKVTLDQKERPTIVLQP